MTEESGTATADMEEKDKLQDEEKHKPETSDTTHDAEDKEYQKDLDNAKKDWEKDRVGPPPGSGRWNKFYWQGKEAERLGHELSEVKETIGIMRKHNEDLMRIVSETKETISSAAKSKEQDDVQTIKADIETLKQQRRTAASENDMATVYTVEDKIDELKELLSAKKDATIDISKDISKRVVDIVREENDKKTFSKFLKETEWYNVKNDRFDEAMTAYADMLWVKANKNWSGTYEDNLYNIKKKVETKFGLSNGKGKSSGLPAVEGAGGKKPPTEPQIELTQEEEKVAVNMFSDLSPNEAKKRYGVQKAIIAKSKEAR